MLGVAFRTEAGDNEPVSCAKTDEGGGGDSIVTVARTGLSHGCWILRIGTPSLVLPCGQLAAYLKSKISLFSRQLPYLCPIVSVRLQVLVDEGGVEGRKSSSRHLD